MNKSRVVSRIQIKVFFLVGLAIALGALSLFLSFNEMHPVNVYVVTKDGNLDIAAVRKALMVLIHKTGSQSTYEVFKMVYHDKPVQIAHAAAHLFGEVLYANDGIAGIAVCDSNFGFGCYHSFFGKAVMDNGIGIVKELDRNCVAVYGPQGLGCSHGIGHGVGEYMGSQKISEQLEICDSLTWKGRFFGCKDGVFMEYNMPTQRGNSEVVSEMRGYNEKEPYGPCLSVEKRFQPNCFLEINNWWEEVLHRDFGKISALCEGLADPDNKEACYMGIGYSMGPKDGYNAKKTRATCNMLGSAKAELLCRAGASFSFFVNPTYRDEAATLCEYTDMGQSNLCMKKSELLLY